MSQRPISSQSVQQKHRTLGSAPPVSNRTMIQYKEEEDAVEAYCKRMERSRETVEYSLGVSFHVQYFKMMCPELCTEAEATLLTWRHCAPARET